MRTPGRRPYIVKTTRTFSSPLRLPRNAPPLFRADRLQSSHVRRSIRRNAARAPGRRSVQTNLWSLGSSQNYLRAAPVSAILLLRFDKHVNFPSSRVHRFECDQVGNIEMPDGRLCRSASAITCCNVFILAPSNCSPQHAECHLEPQPHIRDRTRWPVD